MLLLSATVRSFQFSSSKWKKLINSKDDTSADTLADSRNSKLSYTLYLKDSTLPLVSIASSKLYWKLIEIIQVYPSARQKFSTLFQNSGDFNWEVISTLKQEFFSINY